MSDKNQIQINHELFKLDLQASLKKSGAGYQFLENVGSISGAAGLAIC